MDWQEQCEKLWGDGWKSILSRTAYINRRTVARWANPHQPHQCPQKVQDQINETYKIWIEE